MGNRTSSTQQMKYVGIQEVLIAVVLFYGPTRANTKLIFLCSGSPKSLLLLTTCVEVEWESENYPCNSHPNWPKSHHVVQQEPF